MLLVRFWYLPFPQIYSSKNWATLLVVRFPQTGSCLHFISIFQFLIWTLLCHGLVHCASKKLDIPLLCHKFSLNFISEILLDALKSTCQSCNTFLSLKILSTLIIYDVLWTAASEFFIGLTLLWVASALSC